MKCAEKVEKAAMVRPEQVAIKKNSAVKKNMRSETGDRYVSEIQLQCRSDEKVQPHHIIAVVARGCSAKLSAWNKGAQ
jgi:hypothetical protein